MNKKGFTLVELIAVLVLIILVTLITFPNLRNLMDNNGAKEFTTYQDMMVEYAKLAPLSAYKGKNYICLNYLQSVNDIDDRGNCKGKNWSLEKINNTMICDGYVVKDNNTYKPYLYCTQNGEELYETVYKNEDGTVTSRYDPNNGCSLLWSKLSNCG